MSLSEAQLDSIDTDTQRSVEPEPVESYLIGLKETHEKRLQEIARSLMDGETIQPLTVRTFLSWFWRTQRRGHWIVSYIRGLLQKNGLVTVPDFESTYLDAEMTFALASTERSDLADSTQLQSADVVEITHQTEVRTSISSFGDPTYRISKLGAANHTPILVSPDATLNEAITLMMANDFSQLPVMTSERDVKGAISWKSIGSRLALHKSLKRVRDAMDPHAEVSAEASLFTIIPMIVEHDYALVRSPDKRIVGIITTTDLSLQFQQLSEPFLLLGEIENHIRRIISSRFTVEVLACAKDDNDLGRIINSAADLTFGEYKRLLENPDRWAELELDLDRVVFIKLLERVREIRNDVMHFDPDGIDDTSLTVLRDFVKFLRTLQSIGAT